MADLTNLNYFPEKLDPTLFPGVPSSLEVSIVSFLFLHCEYKYLTKEYR
jgi:hypothetical protein